MSAALSVIESSAPRAGEVVKPPRWNFAGLCLCCDAPGCEAPQCIAWHAASYWMVCPECDGLCWLEGCVPCGCTLGVVEAVPPAADAGRLSAA
jgi:hypothetical protein